MRDNLLALLGIAWGCVICARKEVSFASLRVVGGLCFALSSAFMLQLAFGPELDASGAARTEAVAGVSDCINPLCER